ncbi:hypothetical protein [Dietzia sp. B32]|uniref:hypothetical protein n=1 Tax=Dietzia sp. B32 TaxID=2915130 RepID=UPI0021ADA5E5|nr:hypothetical protein [Dietzia sp. B32]UVE94277.1 hypothetical protein L8M95_12040 [Dietzia sp. B32]
MADGPRAGDDDEAPRLPEVTVPPWLRTGPTPDQSIPGGPAAGRSAGAATGPDSARAGSGEQGSQRDDPPPTRITLGAAGGSDPGRPTPAATGGTRSPGPVGTRPPVGDDPTPLAVPVGSADGRREADDLSTLTLGTPAGVPGRADDEVQPVPAVVDRRPMRIVLLAAAGVAVLGGSAVLGYIVARGAVGPATGEVAGCPEVSEPGRVVGSGPGSLETPAGAVLAFDHSYYVERSAEKAFAVVAPSSRMTVEQLRVDGVEQVPEGTGHCVEVRELSPTLLEVDLTEYPPGADPVLIRQRVRVAENPDGTWGIVSITPAG